MVVVCVDLCAVESTLVDEARHGDGVGLINDLNIYLVAGTVLRGGDYGLAHTTTTGVEPLALVLVALLAADVGLVYLYGAFKQARRRSPMPSGCGVPDAKRLSG